MNLEEGERRQIWRASDREDNVDEGWASKIWVSLQEEEGEEQGGGVARPSWIHPRETNSIHGQI